MILKRPCNTSFLQKDFSIHPCNLLDNFSNEVREVIASTTFFEANASLWAMQCVLNKCKTSLFNFVAKPSCTPTIDAAPSVASPTRWL